MFFILGGVGAVAVGKVEAGILKAGTTIVVAPSGQVAQVLSIEMHHEAIPEATAGDLVAINIDVDRHNLQRGQVVSDDPDNFYAFRTTSFECEISILTPSRISSGFSSSIVFCHQARVPCLWKHIKTRIDRDSGNVLQNNPEYVTSGDACIVEIEPLQELSLEEFSDFRALGTLVIRSGTNTIAAGIVTKVTRLFAS